MRSASYQHASYPQHASLRSRVAAFLLALAPTILIVIMLLRLGAFPGFTPAPKPAMFRLLPEPRNASEDARTVAKVKRAGGASPHLPAPAQTAAVPRHGPQIPMPDMLILTKEEFAAADIAKFPSHPGKAADGAGAGADGGSADGPGEGPNGERLYNAEWYVEPTHAQLAYYLPAGGAQPGWGMIACRTVERYHVEDCRELGETPGSGLARALRQAAWQFLVRPPRIGGHPLVGAWVRIRFDFTQSLAK